MLASYRAPAPDEDAPKALKKYEILGKLARGGMADLFLARAGGLGGFERLLVIKRILPELARDTEFVRMFLDEARTVATLHHSNIVHVYDVDMVDGSVFYAMEHLHGQHVTAILERARSRGTRVPLESAIAIAVAVAAGLHYAHERWGPDGTPLHIVHRDVAPNNVVVTYDGNVKLIDFGIAKSARNLSNTRFGLFKGKLPYASPEQIRCEPVDRRTDVFSLGALLYELTTGHSLFSADNEYELLRLMTEAVVPLPRLRDKAYPRELEAIVLKALAKERDDRHPTAQALQRELEVFASKSQLDLSAFSLSRLMSRLFDDELTDWRTARRAGLTLEQHIATRITASAPVVAHAAAAPEELEPTMPGARPSTAPDPRPPTAPASHPPATPVADPPAPPVRPWRSRVARGAIGVALALGLGALGARGMRWLDPPAPAAGPAPAATPESRADEPPAELANEADPEQHIEIEAPAEDAEHAGGAEAPRSTARPRAPARRPSKRAAPPRAPAPPPSPPPAIEPAPVPATPPPPPAASAVDEIDLESAVPRPKRSR